MARVSDKTREHDANVGTSEFLAEHPARVHRGFGGSFTYNRTFESLVEFANVAKNAGVCNGSRGSRSTNNAKWYGGSFNSAIEMASGKGWDGTRELIANVNVSVEKLVDAETVSDAFTFAWDVTGGAVDIGRFMSGEPECMVDPFPVPIAKRGKVVRIVVPFGISSGVNVEDVKRRGAAIVGLTDALARAHYSLEVWGVMACHGTGRGGSRPRLSYTVKVQSAAAEYDPQLVAYGTGHPTMFRRLSFAVGEHENTTVGPMFGFHHGYYGHPSWEVCIADLPEYAQNGPSIVMPYLDLRETYRYKTEESIAAWITEQVAAIKDGNAFITTDTQHEDDWKDEEF